MICVVSAVMVIRSSDLVLNIHSNIMIKKNFHKLRKLD